MSDKQFKNRELREDLKEEIEKLGPPYIWQNQADIETNMVVRAIKIRYHASGF
jgi:hypothetical protein